MVAVVSIADFDCTLKMFQNRCTIIYRCMHRRYHQTLLDALFISNVNDTTLTMNVLVVHNWHQRSIVNNVHFEQHIWIVSMHIAKHMCIMLNNVYLQQLNEQQLLTMHHGKHDQK
jgi:hypothetical protein